MEAIFIKTLYLICTIIAVSIIGLTPNRKNLYRFPLLPRPRVVGKVHSGSGSSLMMRWQIDLSIDSSQKGIFMFENVTPSI